MINKLSILIVFLFFTTTVIAGDKHRAYIGDGYVYTKDLSTPCDSSTVSWRKKRSRKCKEHSTSSTLEANRLDVYTPEDAASFISTTPSHSSKYLLSFEPTSNPLDLSNHEHLFIKAVEESNSSSKFYITVGSSLNSDDNESSLIRAGFIKDRLIANGVLRESITINQLDFSMPVGRALIEAL